MPKFLFPSGQPSCGVAGIRTGDSGDRSGRFGISLAMRTSWHQTQHLTIHITSDTE